MSTHRDKMLLFLIHGMGRTSFSMAYLDARLRSMGYPTSRFGYRVFGNSLQNITDDFVMHVYSAMKKLRLEAPAGSSAEAALPPYAIIGHSLGNVIARSALPHLAVAPSRMIMLAPPNRSPKLARIFTKRMLFRRLTGNAGVQLASRAFYETLPVPQGPTLVIAGNRGPKGPLSPFGQTESDGVVAVSETRLEGANHVVVPAIHTFIMNLSQTFSLICDFLETANPQPRLPENTEDKTVLGGNES